MGLQFQKKKSWVWFDVKANYGEFMGSMFLFVSAFVVFRFALFLWADM